MLLRRVERCDRASKDSAHLFGLPGNCLSVSKSATDSSREATNEMASTPSSAGSTSGPPSPATRVPPERSVPARVAAEASRRTAIEDRSDGNLVGCLSPVDLSHRRASQFRP